jgi:hypothetical protein
MGAAVAAHKTWARQLQLIKDAEFHAVSPAPACCFQAVYSREEPSPASGIPRGGSRLAWNARMVSFAGVSRGRTRCPSSLPFETKCPLSRRIRIQR